MERSPAAGTTFVKWEEVFSMNHRGRREVRYYLKRRDGISDLVVVGKEKKLGHKTKLTSCSSPSYRYRYAIREKSFLLLLNSSIGISSKLRSRREVIDWLSSVVADGPFTQPPLPVAGWLGAGDHLPKLEKSEDINLRKMNQHATEFLWLGSAWTCRKKRKHYEAYSRNGVRISVHDFVYVLAEEYKRLVAYLDDMYEDSRGNKMAVVRWFHKVDEVDLHLPHSFNDREIFFSLCLQDLSIECIDGLATVLIPHHYDKFLKADVHPKVEPFVCQKLFDNQDFKPFDLTQVKGYWNQNIHSYISSSASNGTRPKKRLRRLVDTERDAEEGGLNSQNGNLAEGFVKCQYTVGSQIEVLSQDSGIRGLWFRAVVVKKHKDKLKVRYQDIKDADDESVNLEEWILSSRIAAPDQMGIRHCGRPTIRPTRSSDNINVSLVDAGSIVDAWLYDGWWEGIVIHTEESNDRIHVYFPVEKQKAIMGHKDLRYSDEWVGDTWKQMKNRPDLAASISSTIETDSKTAKSHDNTSSLTAADNSSLQNKNLEDDHQDDLCAALKWNWTMKKRRNSPSFQRAETRNHDRCVMPFSVKVDRDKCKRCDSSLFGRLVASTLVM